MNLQSILNKILPKKADNTFSGLKLSQYMFILITIVTIGRSIAHMYLPDGGAESIASINLNIESRSTIIGLFYLWGLSQLIIGLLYIIVYIRYKSLIPLTYLLLFFEYLFRYLSTFYKSIVTQTTPPGQIGNYILIPLSLLLLIMSLFQPKKNLKLVSTHEWAILILKLLD